MAKVWPLGMLAVKRRQYNKTMKELIQALVTQLKVTDAQAAAGTGVLFRAAREKLGADEFARLLGKVGGIDALIAQAPAIGGMGKLFGGFASALGGNAALLASVVSGFGKLGMTTDHAQKFVPVVLDHLRGQIGKDSVATLEKTLRG